MMLNELVLKNRSYRGYDESYRAKKEELLDMIAHARLAPSSVNKQPLKYVLVYEKEKVAQIQPLTHWAKALDMELPHKGMYPTGFIIVCQDTSVVKNTDAYLRDVGIVSQTILLRAVEMGLGGCMIGNYNKEMLSTTLNLSAQYYPHLIIAIGKPKETIVLTDVYDENTSYYRDEQDIHYVPKRPLEDLIIE